jgi:hypothetical protein
MRSLHRRLSINARQLRQLSETRKELAEPSRAVIKRIDTESSKWPTKCSSKVQQPQQMQPTGLDPHRPANLHERPSSTFLPLDGKDKTDGRSIAAPTLLQGEI